MCNCWAAGDSVIPGSVSSWVKFTFTYLDFIAAEAGLGYILVKTLESLGGVIEGIILKQSVQFVGATVQVRITDLTASEILLSDFNISLAVGNTILARSLLLYMPQKGATSDIVIEYNAGEGSVNDLIAGSLDVWLKLAVLP